jgi:hypothetical protein
VVAVKIVVAKALVRLRNPVRPLVGRQHDARVPCFANTIASLTLSSSCLMEFTKVKTREKVPLFLPRRAC